MLFRQVGTVVLVVGMGEELQRFFEPDSSLQVPPQSLTLAPIEMEPHLVSITVIPNRRRIPTFWSVIPEAGPPDEGEIYDESTAEETTNEESMAGAELVRTSLQGNGA